MTTDTQRQFCRRTDGSHEPWCGDLRVNVPADQQLGPLCACGKPESHLLADEDSADWPCRVPRA